MQLRSNFVKEELSLRDSAIAEAKLLMKGNITDIHVIVVAESMTLDIEMFEKIEPDNKVNLIN